MRKEYNSPELELVRFSIREVLLTSDPEGEIGTEIGGGGGDIIDLDGLG